jgi:hypothetical protein
VLAGLCHYQLRHLLYLNFLPNLRSRFFHRSALPMQRLHTKLSELHNN